MGKWDLIMNYNGLLDMINSVKCQHTYREGNGVTDRLQTMGRFMNSIYIYFFAQDFP